MKLLSRKARGLGIEPSSIHVKSLALWSTSVTVLLERLRLRRILGAHWAANLTKLMTYSTMKDTVSKIKVEREDETLHQFLSPSCLQTHRYIHPHMIMYITT